MADHKITTLNAVLKPMLNAMQTLDMLGQNTYFVIFSFVAIVGFFILAVIARLRSRDTHQQLQQYALSQMQLRTQNESLQSQLEQAHTLNTAQNERLLEASREATSAKSQLAAQAQYHQQQVQQYQLQHQQQLIEFTAQKKQLNQEFEHIAQKIFSANSQHFSQNQEQSVKLLLAPFRDQLHNFSQQVEHFKQNQTASNASLNTELQHLKALNQQITQEAHTLSRALKSDKKLSGTWG